MTRYTTPEIIKPYLETIPNGDVIRQRNWITSNDLIYIHHLTKIPIASLTKNLQIYKPPPKPSTYTKEFRENLQKLELIAQEEEYQSLINKSKHEKDDVIPSEVMKEIKSQITTIFNVFISVGSVVYAIWYWTQSSGYFSLPIRVLLCLFFGILTLVAEVVVFNAYIRKVNQAKESQQKKEERLQGSLGEKIAIKSE